MSAPIHAHCSWQFADLEDGRHNYSVPRKSISRSPLGEEPFSRGAAPSARVTRSTPRKRAFASDDEEDVYQAHPQDNGPDEEEAVALSLVQLKQQPPRQVQTGRGTASQRAAARERRRGDDRGADHGLPPRGSHNRQSLPAYSQGRGAWAAEERGRGHAEQRTGVGLAPGAVRTTGPRSAGKREARPEFNRPAVEGSAQQHKQPQRSLGLGAGAGPGQASAFTNLRTPQATPPKELRPQPPSLAARASSDDVVGSLSVALPSCSHGASSSCRSSPPPYPVNNNLHLLLRISCTLSLFL